MALSPYIRDLRAHVGSARLLLPSVSGHVFDEESRLLLVQQREGGIWSTPGGVIELDEHPADAAIREMWEETGLEVRIDCLLGVYGGLGLFLLAFRCKALLARPVMIWLGKISYSLYLMQVACVLAGVALAEQLPSGIAKVAVLLATIPFSLLVAHLCARFVEKPAIALGKALICRGRRAPIYQGIDPAP